MDLVQVLDLLVESHGGEARPIRLRRGCHAAAGRLRVHICAEAQSGRDLAVPVRQEDILTRLVRHNTVPALLRRVLLTLYIVLLHYVLHQVVSHV